jgi:K+-transporting ATPase ATPase C chain
MNMLKQHESDSQPGVELPRPFAAEFLSQLKVSIIATLVLAVIVSGIYPAIVWGLAQTIFHDKANGSLIGRDGRPASRPQDAVGSALIGQNFSDTKYFHPRPSAAGSGYDPTASGGSNLGPMSAKLFNGSTKKDDKGNEVVDVDGVRVRIVRYCLDNGITYDCSPPLATFYDAKGNLDDVKLIKALNENDAALVFTPKVAIPPDAVTASGSGLDPHISLENAVLQAHRVAKIRGMNDEKVRQLIDQFTEGPDLGVLGEKRVNVLRLNLALESAPIK